MRREAVVFVIDTDEKVRSALRTVLSGKEARVATCPSAREFLDCFDPQQPGCIVLDPALPEITGFDLQERLALYDLAPPMIFIGNRVDPTTVANTMRRGAIDFLEKPVRPQRLLHRVEEALARDRLNRRLFAWYSELQARAARLTEREREVMHYVVAGLSNRLTAERMKLTRKAVEAYRSRLMRKLQAHSVPELVRMHIVLTCGVSLAATARGDRIADVLGVPLQLATAAPTKAGASVGSGGPVSDSPSTAPAT